MDDCWATDLISTFDLDLFLAATKCRPVHVCTYRFYDYDDFIILPWPMVGAQAFTDHLEGQKKKKKKWNSISY
jgi:hypothetical protein